MSSGTSTSTSTRIRQDKSINRSSVRRDLRSAVCLIREEYEHDAPEGLNSVMEEFASLALTRTRAKNKVSTVL
jgi:hypothetical protein